jgi:hypothetical protein
MNPLISYHISYVEAISFVAPGLPDWQHTQTVLRGENSYVSSELAAYQPTLLPANERRRASPTVRMAFRIAEELTQHSSITADQLACVFSSADGDLTIAQRICSALADTARLVSPTDFHNSVHNAAAGYWSIAANAKGPSTAIAAFDHSFATGLLEAHGMVQVEKQPVLLVVYDVPAPLPLHARRPVAIPAGVGLLLTTMPTANTITGISMQIAEDSITHCDDASLEALRLSNPAARALPLLQALARHGLTRHESHTVIATANIEMDQPRSLQISLHPATTATHS